MNTQRSVTNRRQTLGVSVGFAIAVAFFAVRLWRAGASWTDVREFLAGFANIGLLLCMITPIPLAMFLFGHLLWTEVWVRRVRKMPEDQATAVPWWRVIGVSVLSVFLALTIAGITKMWTPGWMITGTLGIWSGPYHVNFTIGGAIFVAVGIDSTLCFAILWAGYRVWKGFGR